MGHASDDAARGVAVLQPGAADRGTVLLVDDEPMVRQVAARMLVDAGFEVLTAEDGEQGVESFRVHHQRIVAVILDLAMPRLGGEQALDRMREIRHDVPAILSTGYDLQETEERLARCGFAGFISKPYRPAELIDVVTRVARR